MADLTKESFGTAAEVLRGWATTTSANNLRKMIAREIDAAHTRGYMAGYDAGVKSAQFDQQTQDQGIHERANRASRRIGGATV